MSTNLKPVLARLAAGETLSETEAEAAFATVMAGEATPAQIAGMLMAMRVRRETVAELTGAVRAMRRVMLHVAAPPDAIDVCGTGGDATGSLNVSTAVTFVLAGLGVPVAKHGNRALSSRTGGADVLAALGVNVDVPLDRLPEILRAASCVFLFAPRHHAALRHAAGPRVELGTRTIFNLLGPLANPASVRRQLTGVFDPAWARPMVETLHNLGSTHVWLVHGQGMDELCVAGENLVTTLHDGRIRKLHRAAGGCRPHPRADRGHPGRRRHGERGGVGSVAAWRTRPVSRHRAAERRGGADRGRTHGQICARAWLSLPDRWMAALPSPPWTYCVGRPHDGHRNRPALAHLRGYQAGNRPPARRACRWRRCATRRSPPRRRAASAGR